MLFLYSMIYLPLFLEFCLGNFLPSDSDCGLRVNRFALPALGVGTASPSRQKKDKA